MKKLLILLLLVSCISCKSIKKNKKVNISVETETSIIKLDSTVIDTYDSTNRITNKNIEENIEEITEVTEETSKVITVNGTDIVTPTKTTTTTTKKNNKVIETNIVETQLSTDNSISLIKNDSTDKSKNLEQLDLQKESEGIEVISEIVSGLVNGLLGWVKYIILAVVLVIASIIIKKQLNKGKDGSIK